jgi:hypothetical protein
LEGRTIKVNDAEQRPARGGGRHGGGRGDGGDGGDGGDY